MKQLLVFLLSFCLLLSFTACSQPADDMYSYEEVVVGTSIVGGEDTQSTASTDTDITKNTSGLKGENTSMKTDENGKTEQTENNLTTSEQRTRTRRTTTVKTTVTKKTSTYTAKPTVSGKFDKTFVFLGSSVTYGACSGGWSMCDYLAEYHGCTVIKWAVGGTTLVDNGTNSYVQRLLRSIDTQDVCDHFVCQLSTNDATHGKPLGSISDSFDTSDFDTSTIIGAMEYIIATAKEKWNCPVSFYTGTVYTSTRYLQMVNAVLQLKEKWGIGVLDLWNDAQMNSISSVDYNRYMADPIHPNRLGYEKWWGPKFAAYLLG